MAHLLHFRPEGISMSPILTGGDEDLFDFNYSSLGSNTSGTFSMFFDGSDLGVASKVDILAACDF